MKRTITQVLRWLPQWALTVVVLTAILWLTLMPADDAPSVSLFPGADKVIHALMMGAMAAALMVDCNKMNHYVPWWLVASAVTLLGIVIEVAQWAMDMGRSAEWADVVADAIGAFLFAWLYKIVFRPIVLQKTDIWDRMKKLYHDSFPESERRPWAEECAVLSDITRPVSLYMVRDADGDDVGFMTLWHFDGFAYLEHFAIDPSQRGHGFGSQCLEQLKNLLGSNGLVLEVEPRRESVEAARRIAFYERNGFEIHESFEYIQPPYNDGLQPVELKLMTRGLSSPDLQKITATLHSQVYQKR